MAGPNLLPVFVSCCNSVHSRQEYHSNRHLAPRGTFWLHTGLFPRGPLALRKLPEQIQHNSEGLRIRFAKRRLAHLLKSHTRSTVGVSALYMYQLYTGDLACSPAQFCAPTIHTTTMLRTAMRSTTIETSDTLSWRPTSLKWLTLNSRLRKFIVGLTRPCSHELLCDILWDRTGPIYSTVVHAIMCASPEVQRGLQHLYG